MENISRPLYELLVDKLSNQEELSLPETLVLLVEVRRYIEEHNLSEEFRVAKFFCDWALHFESNRSQNSQQALDILNQRLRNPNLSREETIKYMQTVFDAIQYSNMGKQVGEIIVSMTQSPFTITNHLMFSILKCLIGIPLVPSEKHKYKEQRNKIENEILQELSKWNNKHKQTTLYSNQTEREAKLKIKNFMITEVHSDGTIYIQLQREDDSYKYGFVQVGKASTPLELWSTYLDA